MAPTSSKKAGTSSRKKLDSLKFVGGSKFMKELQRTVFFAAYESVVFSSGKSVTDKEQREMLRKSILGSGDPDELTLPEQMVLGLNQFGHLYEDVPVTINDDWNAQSTSTTADRAGIVTPSRNEYEKRLKDCFFPQKSTGGKLAIYANKPDGITKSLLTSKNLSNPVDVSVLTIMRGAKEVLRNGRKALACAKDSDSEYRDGTLPSGKSIDDYHRFIRERMYVKLRGATGFGGGDDDAEDDVLSDNDTTARENQEDCEQSDAVSPDKLPEDWYFSGMLAFFLWGYIVEYEECAAYKSKQFQIGDTTKEEKGMNSRKQVKKECARAATKQRDSEAALAESPFRRGTTCSQEIEIVKIVAFRSSEERKSLETEYQTAQLNIQSEIDNRMALAKVWGLKERNDPIFLEIQDLMAEQRELTLRFKENKHALSLKQSRTDEMIDGALGGSNNKRQKSSQSSISTTAGSSTPASSNGAPPTASVAFATNNRREGESAPPNDECEEGGMVARALGEYLDCTVDMIGECYQRPPPFDKDDDLDE